MCPPNTAAIRRLASRTTSARTSGRAPTVDLGREVMLGDLPHASYDLIRNACEPQGHFYKAAGGNGVRYAFWRDVTDSQRRR